MLADQTHPEYGYLADRESIARLILGVVAQKYDGLEHDNKVCTVFVSNNVRQGDNIISNWYASEDEQLPPFFHITSNSNRDEIDDFMLVLTTMFFNRDAFS